MATAYVRDKYMSFAKVFVDSAVCVRTGDEVVQGWGISTSKQQYFEMMLKKFPGFANCFCWSISLTCFCCFILYASEANPRCC